MAFITKLPTQQPKLSKLLIRGRAYNYTNEYSGSVIIPSSVTYSGTTYSVTEIGDGAFYYCKGLKSITIPNSVTSIDYDAFRDCSGLTSVTIPNSVTSIGSYAFEACTGLTSVTTPNSVTSIDYDAFRDCSGLTSVIIPNSVTKIGEWAFYECEGLTEVNIYDLSAWCRIDFGLNYANPMYYAKKLKLNGTEIKDLVIPNNITQIKDYAFYSCTGLTSVTIPNSVTKIGDHAFSECYGLTSVSIPNSVTEIGSDAFESCGIRLIMCHCAVPPTCGSDAFGGEIDSYSALLMIPEGSLIDYAIADEWHKFTQVHEVSEANVSTQEKKATFEIPTIEGATMYEVTVYSDITMSQLVATTHYDAYGKITPMSISLELSIDGFDDGVYYYKVLVKSVTGEVLNNYIGTFEIDATGIDNIEADNSTIEVARYDIHGSLLTEPTKGINIVKYSDGTIRKEIVK